MSTVVFSPFTQATGAVFKLLLDLDATTSEPLLLKQQLHAPEMVSIVIGVVGDLTGNIYYRFPKPTMLEMVQIMSGMEMDKIDEFVMSAVGEIANIISGNALMELAQEKINCDILPPRFLEGEEVYPLDKPVTSAIIKTTLGDIQLDFQI